ncbi:hypothetical protein ACFLS7_06825 [Bacteroidota bacterium]
MMKQFIILLSLLLSSTCYSQDYIYKKDNTIQKGKVVEVTLDLVKYNKIELPKGPVFEISVKDVYKILFSNGYEEVFDTAYRWATNQTQLETKNADTSHFATLYILFHSGNDMSQKFPIYFNEKYICTLRNHQRLTYTMYSEGLLRIVRVHEKKTGPYVELLILHGNNYGIRILEPYPQGLDPNKRFSMDIITDNEKVAKFLKKEFYKLKPFKEDEFIMREDLKDPIIQ